MTSRVASTDLLKAARVALADLSEVLSSDCYIYDADFCDLQETHNEGAGANLPEPLNPLLHDLP